MSPILSRSLRIGAGVALSLGLGWFAIRGVDWGAVVDNLSRASLLKLSAAVAVFMIASWLRALRWQILFVKDPPSVRRLFVIQNEGLGLNNVLPVRVASEAVQLAVLTIRDGVNGATALATLGMERVLDVVASTFILALAFFFVPEMRNFTPYVAGAFAFALVVIALVRAIAWGSGLAFITRFRRIAEFGQAVRALERERGRLALSSAATLLYWLTIGLTAWIVANAIALPITPVTATLVIMGTIFFATAVPAAPSAIGTFEFAVVYVLGFFSVDRSEGFGFAVIVHAVFFLPPTLIAAVFLPREGVLTMRGRRAAARAADAKSSG